MLRITRISDRHAITLKLEGKLAGPWVGELEKTWRSIKETATDRPLILDLNDVMFIDRDGERLLKQVAAAGTSLVAEGPYISQRLLRIISKKPR